MDPFAVSAEENENGSILFALSYPGACGWGADESIAKDRLRTGLSFTEGWLARHDFIPELYAPLPEPLRFRIVERVPATGNPLDCDSEGFFDRDARGYTDRDVGRTRRLLTASRADLLDLTRDLDGRVLNRRLRKDRRTVREILEHIATTEHWYMTRIELPFGLPPDRTEYPAETFEYLTGIRADVDSFLDAVIDVPADEGRTVWRKRGERWTVAKVLRRFVWHELLHYYQLVRLVPKVDHEEGE